MGVENKPEKGLRLNPIARLREIIANIFNWTGSKLQVRQKSSNKS